jgi:hypothetical protein
MANRIINSIKTLPKPGFLLAGYQRLRQDDFANRTDPGNSDISIPRLLQVVNKIKADPTIGATTEVVTIERMSILMRKFMGLSDVKEDDIVPNKVWLSQNYPNPFNPITVIAFLLPEKQNVSLKVYDILGKEVVTLVDEELNGGYYEKTFNAINLSSGIYFYRLITDNYNETKKMLLIK